MAMAYEIVRIGGGPGKFDPMLSLFDSTLQKPRLVDFELEVKSEICNKFKLSCKITMIAQEDGSGDSWIFEGGIMNGEKGGAITRGFYSTKNRKGSMEIRGL